MPLRVLLFLAALLAVPGLTACPAQAGEDTPAPGEPAAEASAGAAPEADPALAAVAGKLGCTASRYDAGSQSHQFQPRGSVVLDGDGSYAYLGFEEPSRGTFRLGPNGALRFSGGHLDGGEATSMEDRPGRYYLVFPANPDNRWTCGRVEG